MMEASSRRQDRTCAALALHEDVGGYKYVPFDRCILRPVTFGACDLVCGNSLM